MNMIETALKLQFLRLKLSKLKSLTLILLYATFHIFCCRFNSTTQSQHFATLRKKPFGENAGTGISSLSQNVFYPFQKTFQVLGHIYVVCFLFFPQCFLPFPKTHFKFWVTFMLSANFSPFPQYFQKPSFSGSLKVGIVW